MMKRALRLLEIKWEILSDLLMQCIFGLPQWPYADNLSFRPRPDWPSLYSRGPVLPRRVISICREQLQVRTIGDVRRLHDEALLRHLNTRELYDLRSATVAPDDLRSEEYREYLFRLNVRASREEHWAAMARNADLYPPELYPSVATLPERTP